MHFLITSGGTREYIDPVRFISNASSGKMGYALAREALAAGHKVTLATTLTDSGPKTRDSRLNIVKVETAAEMFEAVKQHFARCDCLIMAAAVADYTPVKKSKIKIQKSTRDLKIRLKPTVDILKWAGRHKNSKLKTQNSKLQSRRRLVVGFALEDKNLRTNAERKMREKNLDMIIANSPASIGADKATVQIKTSKSGWVTIKKATKITIAKKIIHEIKKYTSS